MYILPFFFPDAIWLGLTGIIAGIAQLGQHGIVFNRLLRSFYNPGLFAVAFLHVPIGIYYIYVVQSAGASSILDWVIAMAIIVVVFLGFASQVIYKVLPDKNTPYPFTEKEINKFHIAEKLKRKGLL